MIYYWLNANYTTLYMHLFRSFAQKHVCFVNVFNLVRDLSSYSFYYLQNRIRAD